jgi:hypothetical protein
VISEEKKRHEDEGCALLSLCLRGTRTQGEGDNNLCYRHRLLFFKATTMRRKKKTRKKPKDPPVGALASSYSKEP